MKKKVNKLPDSELEVMQVLWKFEPPVKRNEIEEEMAKIHPIAQTTLLTLLTRLSDKGFVKIEKQGRSSVYTPLVSENDYQASESASFVKKLFHGNMSAFASALRDSGLSKDDLLELSELLESDQL